MNRSRRMPRSLSSDDRPLPGPRGSPAAPWPIQQASLRRRQNAGGPIVVFVHAGWCVTCRKGADLTLTADPRSRTSWSSWWTSTRTNPPARAGVWIAAPWWRSTASGAQARELRHRPGDDPRALRERALARSRRHARGGVSPGLRGGNPVAALAVCPSAAPRGPRRRACDLRHGVRPRLRGARLRVRSGRGGGGRALVAFGACSSRTPGPRLRPGDRALARQAPHSGAVRHQGLAGRS
jgi:hypothetical protein